MGQNSWFPSQQNFVAHMRFGQYFVNTWLITINQHACCWLQIPLIANLRCPL